MAATSSKPCHGSGNCNSSQASGKAGKVPKVPGALGASPVPKPKPSKHTGFLNNQANVGVTGGVDGLAKMIVSLLVKLERVAAGI